MTHCWKSCCIPFCNNSTYAGSEEDKVCAPHGIHVRQALWISGPIDADAWKQVVLDAILGGLMHLPGAGDERRARNRHENRRKRQVMAA